MSLVGGARPPCRSLSPTLSSSKEPAVDLLTSIPHPPSICLVGVANHSSPLLFRLPQGTSGLVSPRVPGQQQKCNSWGASPSWEDMYRSGRGRGLGTMGDAVQSSQRPLALVSTSSGPARSLPWLPKGPGNLWLGLLRALEQPWLLPSGPHLYPTLEIQYPQLPPRTDPV